MAFWKLVTLLGCATAAPAAAIEDANVVRLDRDRLTVHWHDADPVDVYVSESPILARGAKPMFRGSRAGEATWSAQAGQRRYIVLRDRGDGSLTVVAERLLPLEQGSNFRDIGGYRGAGGKTVRWGKIYRSGALPVLTNQDYRLLGGLGIDTIVDLRANEEREVAPDQLDDRTGALFISNDYSIVPLMKQFAGGDVDAMYAGLEIILRPQLRSLFKRLLAGEGATLVHCSAGQDRTGIAVSLILSALGVDRRTIIEDYHLSTSSRRPQWEMPKLDLVAYPGNPIVQRYAVAVAEPGGIEAKPLYNQSGQSHLVQFLAYMDKTYGSIPDYLNKELALGSSDIAKLRARYLR
ncbi:tyrosine-protein phosphatase [Sphingobium sp. AN641]|uniref:tyrosine-protein phosphatase n=1 Tax=Sphingobium sp. AN641 TaxID=3133443 RepID=UPI0030C0F0FE